MRYGLACLAALGLGGMLAASASGATIYNNLTPNDLIGVASRPDLPGSFEIEAGDDFVLGQQTHITTATFIGVIVPGASGAPSISAVVAEIYRVFPADSNSARTPNVPTRANSPSDVAFDSRDSAAGESSFTTSVLSGTFTTLNSVQPGGIHPSPNQTTLGDGPLTGQEVQITVAFTTPFDLPADHYFFIPQVALTNGGQFYWLSASRPISGAGTTPFAPDLQVWTRDANLDPDWLRVGTDIVGGTPAPTFNAAFSLEGNAVPEPATAFVVLAGLALLGAGRRWLKA
ncbi:MAG TPA: PEP-CTERM sorting domain-containing protein [Armatimonadota bacterium]